MALPANATLVFKTQTGSLVADGMGNEWPSTSDFVVKATLRRDSAPVAQAAAGLSPSEVRMRGFSVNPKFIPPSLPRECSCTLTDPVSGETLTGKMVLEIPMQSKFKAVGKALGTAIRGTFVEGQGH